MKRSFERSYAALDELFRFLDSYLDGRGIGESAAFAARLALEEVFTNMVKYSTSSTEDITVQIRDDGEGLILVLEDADSEPFDPTAHPEPDLSAPLAERRPGGLGLHLVRNLVDSIQHVYVDGKNVVKLHIRSKEHS